MYMYIYIYIYIYLSSCAWDKNLWYQRAGSTNRRLKGTKLRNRYMQCIFTKQLQSLLLHANIN